MKQQVKRKTWTKGRVVMLIIGIFLIAYSLTMLMPLYYMLVNSFKRFDDFLEGNGWDLPGKFIFTNYAEVFQLTGFFQMVINSFLFNIAAVLITTTATTVTAYVLAKYRFPGRGLLVTIGVGSLVIPDLGSSSTVYKLFLDLHLLDTWGILVKYTTPFGLNFLLLFSLFSTVAKEYTEAAELDGAGDMTVFLRICLPMAKGLLSAVVLINFINFWNDYMTPYLFMPNIKMLSVGLQELSMSISQFDRPKLFAGMVVAVLPVLVLFVSMRDKVISSISGGGLKG